MVHKKTNKLTATRQLVVFMLAFFAVDLLRLFCQRATLFAPFTTDRLFIWVVPTLLFIFFVLKQNPFDYLKLKKNVMRGVTTGLAVSAVQAILHCSYYYMSHGGSLAINLNLGFAAWWNVILTAGVVEEVVFRGLIFQYLNRMFSFITAAAVSSVLFALAHIPYWIASGALFTKPMLYIVYDFIFIFFIGFLWAFLLKKTGSLWSNIIHHTANNFLAGTMSNW